MKEIKHVKQNIHNLKRRWFEDEYFDLFIWEDCTKEITIFQLSYNKQENQHAVTWEKKQGFIHNKLGDAVSGGSLMAIVSVAFFAVYREGAETILFYQALVVDVGDNFQAILAGFALALVLLGLVYVFIFQLSVRLPLKQFFSATACLLFLLSLIFAGKSVLELQVAGWVSTTYITWLPGISWLGIFPSLEAISLQMIFLLLPVLLFLFIAKKEQKKKMSDARVDALPE